MQANIRETTRRIVVVFACLCASHSTWGQFTAGRIEGTVMDTTGAVLNGAKVLLVSLGTNATRTFITGHDGYYAFVALVPGKYELRAESPRFTGSAVEVLISSNHTARQDLVLTVGQASERVEVTSVPELLNSSDSQRSVTRSALELSSLPNVSRNMISTVEIAPGITPTNNPRGGSTFGGGGSFVIVLGVQSGLVAANGGRARATSVQLDNTDANDWEAGGFAPGMQAITPDMLEEVRILTSNFSAEYGVKSNAQIIMVTKSGTNFFHGSAYDFVQNDAFNARDYFDQTGKPSPLKQNNYGLTAGGPLVRDRTFVFVGYEGRKTRGGSFTTLANVPSSAARGASTTDPTVKSLMQQFLPLPTASTSNPLIGTVAVQVPSPVDNYQFVIKADHQITAAHRISIRYLQGTASFVARFPSQNTLRGFDVDNHFELRNANLTETFVVTDKTVNELRLAYGRSVAEGTPQNGVSTPRFQVSGLVNFGALQSVPASRVFNVFQVNEVVSHIHGGQILRFGADARKIQDNSVNASNSRGVFTFASLSQFLAGQPSAWTQLFGNTARAFRTGLYGFFVQDDWKMKPSLTVNLGLRWEVQGGLGDAQGNTSTLDAHSMGTIGVAGEGALGTFRIGDDAIHANPFNIAPRVGFAWNPGGGRFVVRGGYGIFWDSFTFTPLAASRWAPPFNYTPSLSCPAATSPACQITGANSFANLLNGTAAIQAQTRMQVGSFGSLTNFKSVTTSDPDLANPYVQQFSFGIERQMPAHSVVTVAYVGTKGAQLTRLVAINPLLTRPSGATSTADELSRLAQFQSAVAHENGVGNARLDPRFDQVNLHEAGGGSIYHSLQLEWKKAFSRGLQFQASYTWSKSIDDASDFSPTIQANDNSFAQSASDPRSERSVSNFDIAHRAVVTGMWQIPFFANLHGFSRALLHGWNFESVNMWQTGLPATLLSGARLGITDVNLDGNLIPTGADNTRANCAADASFQLGKRSATHGFTQPLLGNDGNCGRNSVRMDHLLNFDWSLFKETPLTEGHRWGAAPLTLQLRAEAYNIFNVPFLTAQGDNWRSVASPSFGLYNAAGNARRLQFAARLMW